MEPHTLLVEMERMQPLGKTIHQFLKKLNIKLPYDSVVPLIYKFPKELKTGPQTNICPLMFITALFTIAERRKQSKCPSTDECIDKVRYIHAVEYYSAIKINEILILATTQMNFENIVLSERRWTH